jgi:hypothetical protein
MGACSEEVFLGVESDLTELAGHMHACEQAVVPEARRQPSMDWD